jgi:hypothetical protein
MFFLFILYWHQLCFSVVAFNARLITEIQSLLPFRHTLGIRYCPSELMVYCIYFRIVTISNERKREGLKPTPLRYYIRYCTYAMHTAAR